jgi:hypothetical protein
MATTPETPEQCAARLGLSTAFVRLHYRSHICVDGKGYQFSCLVSDPDFTEVAHYFMRQNGIDPS